jgi:hypothetical protein
VFQVEAVEYVPAEQAVHMVAPGSPPLSVMEPGKQIVQSGLPEIFWYFEAGQLKHTTEAEVDVNFPASQAEHSSTFNAVEYLPGEHATHLGTPSPAKNPARQRSQACCRGNGCA